MVNKRHLAAELSIVVKRAIQEQKNGNEIVSNDVTNSVCNILEALFIHGLREAHFSKHVIYHDKYPEPNFWPFIQKFTHRNIRAQIGNLNQIKTDVGRARVWLRIALNDGLLESYVSSISREPQIVGHYYYRGAFMRDTEQMEVMSNYVRALSKLPFKAPVNSNMLNTWTPTPLQMAGLLAPAEKSQNSPDSTPEMESLDVVEAMSALEFEGLDDVRMMSDSHSDSASVVYSTASPESVVPRGQTFLADRSVFSDGDSILSSLPGTPSNNVLDDVSQEVRLKSILDSFNDKNSIVNDNLSPVQQRVVSDSPQVQRDFVKPTENDTNEISMNTDGPPLPASEEEETLNARTSLSESDQDDENTPRVEEQIANPFAENSLLRSNNFDSDLEFSFSPGNSLLGKNGWSSSQLVEDEKLEKSDDEIAVGSLPTTFSADSTNFSTALHNVLKTKINDSDDNNEQKLIENNSNSNESVSKVPFLVSAVNTYILRKTSGFEIREESVEIQGKSSESVECTDQDKNNVDFVVVENTTNVNVEPAEKAFRMSFLTTIANETGLSNQDFKCNSCKRSIGLMFGSYRMCHFDGHYYCGECHLNEESFIPSRILYSWDFKPRKVCRASKAFLDHVVDQPLIRLSQCNATLTDVVEKIAEVNKLRLELSYLAMYLLACRDIVAEDLRRRVWPKEYLYQEPDLFSVMDLINSSNGQLQKHLKSVILFATKHVLDTCRLCSNKGFVCEICNDSKIIYPFQVDVTQRCTKCYSVYHKGCAEGRPCPKCLRRDMYSKNTVDSGIEMPPFADG